MNPQMLQLILFGVQEAIKAAPELVGEFEDLFNGDAPTDAEFDALRQKISGETYLQFVPQSQIKPGT